ncbi:MAG: FecR family protein [Acidobacteriota bacterium]|nr:FecR family protein [Acidobacteriota bacterium]
MHPVTITALVLCSGLSLSAQSVISAHSGTLHMSEGTVLIDGKTVDQKFGTFPDWKEKSELRTEMGRAEVLLTPGVFLRVGENSSVRMIDNRLIATRVELVSGEAVVEAADPMKENSVTLVYGGYQIHVRKSSVFALQAQPAELKVYHGEAEVEYDGNLVVVKSGRMLPFSPALAAEKFDAKEGDALTRWSERRSEYVATANVSAAKSLRDSGSTWSSAGWYFNPYYSMYTYIPGRGVSWSPYGYGYYSPYSVYSYLPAYGYGSGYGYRGYNGGSTRSGDQSGGFGRTASSISSGNNTGFGRAASSVSAGNSAGFGRGASSIGSGSSSGAASSGHSSGGGTFSGGGNIGGGSRGSK